MATTKPAKKAPAKKTATTAKSAAKAPAKKKAAAPRRAAAKSAAGGAKPRSTKPSAAKPAARAAKPAAKKALSAKTAAAKPAAKKAPAKAAAKTATKTAVKKSAAASPAAKKAAEKPAAKKTAAKKTAEKKASPAKTGVKKTGPQKAAAKKTPPAAAAKLESAEAKAAAKSSADKKAAGGAKVDERKKLMVGQKPRSAPSEPTILPTAMREAGASPTLAEDKPAKPSAASKEAKQAYKVNDHIVYPAHGVGKIVSIEKQIIAGITNELFVIVFEQEKMKLRVPTAKAVSVGMRPLSEPSMIAKAVETLSGRARIKRTMWSRRAQEYDAKINSGDIISVAEVVRDLYRAADQPEQSYSERQLFEQAIDRLAREVAAVRKVDLAAAIAELDASLQEKKAA
ncbi:MAG: CarD family transcriptional regulator [Parvularculaceae bacterium]